MEWATVQHLDLRHAGGRRSASSRPLQPHAATFRASQAIVAVAIGTHIIGRISCSFPALSIKHIGKCRRLRRQTQSMMEELTKKSGAIWFFSIPLC